MAIDIHNEQLVLFHSPRDYWPVSPAPHISQLHRWRLNGLLSRSGQRVKLETLMIGGRRYTSLEAVSRYIAALNDETPVTAKSKTVSRDAGKALEAIGA